MNAAIDMNLPETFHRLKRTVLLFSAALIVMGIAVPATTNTVHLTLIDLDVATAQTVALLWLGALYYFGGFLLEVLVARRLNTEAMRMVAAGEYDAQIRRAASLVEAFNSRHSQLISEVIEKTEEAKSQLLSSIEQRHAWLSSEAARLQRDFPELLEQFLRVARDMGDHPDAVKNASAGAAQRFLSGSNHSVPAANEVERTIQNAKAAEILKALGEQNDKLASHLETVHRDMTRLSRNVANERRLSFWLWEIGGAGAAFVVATLINIEQLNAAAYALRQHLGWT